MGLIADWQFEQDWRERRGRPERPPVDLSQFPEDSRRLPIHPKDELPPTWEKKHGIPETEDDEL